MSLYGRFYRNVLLPIFDAGIKGRRTLQYWRDAEESQWWSAEEHEDAQVLALQGLLRHARDSCLYYGQRWAELGLRVEQICSLGDFRAFPLITRESIRENRLRMRTTRPVPLIAKSTGGSSGEPLQFDLSADSNDRRTAMMYRGYGWADGAPGSRQLYIWGTASGMVPLWKRCKMSLHHAFDNHHVLSCFEFTPERMRRQAKALNAWKPESIVAYTNPLYEFARFLEAEGITPWQPKSLIVGAEKLHDFQRRTIERVFRAPLFETYGSREFMLIGAECEKHAGLHLSQENLLVEILEDDGSPTPPGREGNVVITDLYNYGMPFIRYVNGDRAIAGFETCPCGRGLPLLKQVTGRQLDVLTTPAGRKIPGEFFPHLIKDFPAIRRFQVVQERREEIGLKLVVDGGLTLGDREQLLREIDRGTGGDVRIALEIVPDIPLTKAGKLKVVVNACPN